MSTKLVVVDTNVIFSILLTKDSYYLNHIISSDHTFFLPRYAIVELFKHKNWISNRSKMDESEILEVFTRVLRYMRILDDNLVSDSSLIAAYRLCKKVDPYDTEIVALALEMNAELWTRDRALKSGLEQAGFTRFYKPDNN